MKKNYLVIAAACALIAVACNKEESIIPEDNNSGKVETLTAVIEEGVFTKTNYTPAGVFSWSEDDQFARLGRPNDIYGTTSNYTAEAGIEGETSGDFTGTAPDGALSYAIYPVSASNGANITLDGSGYTLYLNRPSEITYDSANPLKNLIPMMGKLNGTYEFKPISGAIGFHATNIPATAASITLTTKAGTKGLSGRSVGLTSYNLDEVGMGEDLRSNNGWVRGWMASNNTGVTLTFNPGSFTAADFYFPVPPSYDKGGTGASSLPYEGITITLKNAAGDVVGKASTTRSIEVDRAEIIWLPQITFPSTSVAVAITGTSTDIKAYISSSLGSFDKVCVAPLAGNSSTDLDSAIPDNNSGVDLTGITSEANAVSIPGFTTSGTNYIGVKAFSGDSEVYSTILDPVYYLNATDEANIIARYGRDVSIGSTTSTVGKVDLFGDNTITLAVSTDPTFGNIMITEFAGLNYNVSASTFSTYSSNSYDLSSCTNGNPVFGVYGDVTYDGKPGAVFKDVNTQTLYVDATNHNHNIGTGQGAQKDLQLAFNTDKYYTSSSQSTGSTHDLAVWHPYIENCYNNSLTSYDFYFNGYTANKTTRMIPLTSSMLSAFSTLTSGAAARTGGVAALVDKASGSTAWWCNYGSADSTDDQGVWIQIDLGEGQSVKDFTIKFLTVDFQDGIPSEYKVAVSNDGTTWTDATAAIETSHARGAWYQQKVSAGANYRYVRLCITKTYAGSQGKSYNLVNSTINASTSGGTKELTYTHLDEIQLWED